MQYKVIRLIELDGQRILDEGPSGLIPFAPLMQRPVEVRATVPRRSATVKRLCRSTLTIQCETSIFLKLLG